MIKTLFSLFFVLAGGVSSLLAAEVEYRAIRLTTEDDRTIRAVVHFPKGQRPNTALLAMHPRGDNSYHFTLTPAAERGMVGIGVAGRYVYNRAKIIHEELVLDIAAAIRYLREDLGVRYVILIGHSGGGSLTSLYQAQAGTEPPHRLTTTAAGDPLDLNDNDLPQADGLITMAAHKGEGRALTWRLDPSVTDENDPYSVNPEMDMYNPDNGYRKPPQLSKYSPEFIKKYRAAQLARMERLDQMAKNLVRQQKDFEELMARSDFETFPLPLQSFIRRRAIETHYMVVYRTEADLRYTDLSIDPSDRVLGTNFSPFTYDPELENYSAGGRPRAIIPRSFLSTRSGPSSNAALIDNIRRIRIPTMVMTGTADRGIHPMDTRDVYDASGSQDKSLVFITGANHSFLASGPKSDGTERQRTLDAIFSWIEERF